MKTRLFPFNLISPFASMKMDQQDSEEEYDYEETTVMVELQGILENDFLGKVTQAKILGIDTDKPLLQLDDYTFTGQYSETVGTHLLFEDKTDPNEAKPDEKKLEYSCLTNKKLCLQRVFLKPNDELTHMDTSTGRMVKSKNAPNDDSSKTEKCDTENQPGTSGYDGAASDKCSEKSEAIAEENINVVSMATEQDNESQEKT